MKLSSLIRRLKEIQSKEGDLIVEVHDRDYDRVKITGEYDIKNGAVKLCLMDETMVKK